MEKHLVTIEFRYNIKPKNDNEESKYISKTITIGVYDTIEDAIKEGNKNLEVFEKHFKLNPHWNKKERFSLNGGAFGSMKNLVTNLAYLKTPFDFFAKITKLQYQDTEETILIVLSDLK